MVEATTDACTGVGSHTSSTLITDEWTAYDKDGHPTAEWELTPNSTQYYESTATYTGPTITALDLASPSLFTATYKLDGEGRWNALTTGANTIVPSTGVTYNAAGQPTNISLGTGTDYDGYAYDPNTLLMTGWTFQVNSADETGALTWNPNNTLQKLVITDGFNTNGSMTCSYNSSLVTGTGYDDLGRLVGHSCTGNQTWSQAFSYDQYNNVTKSGTGFTAWNPTYSQTTNHYACTGCTYDSNGDVTNDGTNAYSWNVFSKMASVNMSGSNCATNGDCIIYDALGRAVEIDAGSGKTEIWYTPLGKTAYMNGTTFGHSYLPAPGGGTVYSESYYMHKDWTGNARIISYVPGTPSVYTDRAYASYGEVFNIFGSTVQSDAMFVGLTQDIFSGMYDTPNREMTAVQSRFMSPDPAGVGWNQYAWPTNPNAFSDSTGLEPGGPNGPTCNIIMGGRQQADSGCGGGESSGGGGDGGGGGDDSGFLGSDGFGDPFAGAGGPSISPLEGNLEDENMLSLAGDPSYLAAALLAGPQQAGGSVGADLQDTTPASPDGPLDLSLFLDLNFGACTNYVMADCGAPNAANNRQQQPQQPQPKKPSWTQKYLSCVVNTAAVDTVWSAIASGAIGVGTTVIVTGVGAVAGSELGPGGMLAGAGLGFALSAPFIVPSIADGAIAGAGVGVIHGGIACLWGG